MKKSTLKELADIGAEAALDALKPIGTDLLYLAAHPRVYSVNDEPARQAFARAVKDTVEKPLLERIRELESKIIVATLPIPPTADGKTPGQVLYEHFNATAATWGDVAQWYKDDHDKAAYAVLAAFGQASQATAVEAKPACAKGNPVIVLLDHTDIRATDEFKEINSGVIETANFWDEGEVDLSYSATPSYTRLAANYLRRQHGSNEWKPCTKESK